MAYTLRTRQSKITPEEAAQIKECRNSEKLNKLAIAFDLKEDFFNIYNENRTSKENAQKAFSDWEKSIPADDIFEPFRTLAKTVHNFYEQIFNYWDCPIAITNGFTEYPKFDKPLVLLKILRCTVAAICVGTAFCIIVAMIVGMFKKRG
ncbi:MAG: transposase [Intestinimonas sp.]|uniref:transposase n=1 Tax=Intestinimonas sp. TaxID=1965293 RepID=UPI002A90E529|nr:transposase [Intestinimonas sp.]MDY5338049.1 transposase [Intestinimonas sp.]